jgi:hypothetical protein
VSPRPGHGVQLADEALFAGSHRQVLQRLRFVLQLESIKAEAQSWLTRKRVKGVYRSCPKVANDDLLRGLVADFVGTTLGGSVSPFVAYLSEGGPISDGDLDTLKRLVAEMEDQRKRGHQ